MSDRERRGVRLAAEGLELEVPPGWESRIRRGKPEQAGETLMPVLHAATVPLDAERADFGAGVVERLGPEDVFISLVEFGPEAAGSKLFPEVERLPNLLPDMFHPSQLQRTLRGQAGTQIFFTYQGRAFCLYVVIGANARRVELTRKAQTIIRRLTIRSRA